MNRTTNHKQNDIIDTSNEEDPVLPDSPFGRDWFSWRQAFIGALVTLTLLGTLVLSYFYYLSLDLPPIEQLQNFSPATATKVISRDGKVISELFTERRVLISMEEMPVDVRHALLAMEDHRFYEHWGVSMRDFARAVVVNLATMRFTQGFSSLTQQLARNLYDTIGFKKTISRKLKEVITAIQIERTYTKEEILEMYLNSIHFGHGTYGIQAAATKYFGIDARRINLEQAALLVGVLPSPARYSPITHPDRAFRRRNIVLKSMVIRGFLDQEEYDNIKYEPLSVKRRVVNQGYAAYFTENVRQIMERIDEDLGINLYRDGLEIHTTLDSRMQDIAERVFMEEIHNNQKYLDRAYLESDSLIAMAVDTTVYPVDSVIAMIEGDLPIPDELKSALLVQGALVVLENDTGNILALVGGRKDYPDYWNRATQAARQPGSTFKPMLYLTAIENGYPVSHQLLNQSLASTGDTRISSVIDTSYWDPQNDDGSSSGLMTLREGLRWSKNLVSARMIQELVTPAQVVQTAKRLQITTSLRAVRSISLGSSEVYPLELAASYASIANRGVWVEPISVMEVVDRRGKVLRQFIPERKEVIREDQAYILLDIMKGVMRGTAGSTNWKYGFSRPAAGKTGTTDNFTDAWFVGFTPFLTACVWIGVDDNLTLGDERYGGEAALPIWARMMREIHREFELSPNADWPMPDGVVVMDICKVTKDLPTKYCPRERELFIEGTEPPDQCQVHTGQNQRRYNPKDDIFLKGGNRP